MSPGRIVGREAYADALATLAAFIGWAEVDNRMFGGRMAGDALEALSFVSGIPISKLREVAGTSDYSPHRPRSPEE